MSRNVSSSLVNTTCGEPYCGWADTSGGLDNGRANTSDPNSMVTEAISPPSFSSNAILDSSSIMHQEQAGLAPLENASLMKRQKVVANQENHCWPPPMPVQNQRLDSLQSPQLQAIIKHPLQQRIAGTCPWIHQNAQQLHLPWPMGQAAQPPFVEGICARRLVQYMDKQRPRPPVSFFHLHC